MKITIAVLDEYLAREEKRREFQRQADAIERETKQTAALIVAWVEAEGGKARSCKKGKHTASLEDRPGTVKWKDELIRVAGAAAAEKLQAAAPTRTALVIN